MILCKNTKSGKLKSLDGSQNICVFQINHPMPKYIKIHNFVLDTNKILRVHARKSYAYIRYPHVIEIEYAKIHKEVFYGISLPIGIPIGILRGSVHIKLALAPSVSKEDIIEYAEQFKCCPNAEIINDTNVKTTDELGKRLKDE